MDELQPRRLSVHFFHLTPFFSKVYFLFKKEKKKILPFLLIKLVLVH